MREIFLQIVLLLLGAILGVIANMLTNQRRRLMLGILAFAMVIVGAAWGGYELGFRQARDELTRTQPTTMPTASLTIAPTHTPSPVPINTTALTPDSGVSCSVNGRVPVPDIVPCNSGRLSVSIKAVGATEYPHWDRAFNGLVSQIDVATGVIVTDRIEKWGPPGKWDTLEAAGWLTLQGPNNMMDEFAMTDEVSNSTIKIRPNKMSQELQFRFAPKTVGFTVATICENVNPCSGQVMEFVYIP